MAAWIGEHIIVPGPIFKRAYHLIFDTQAEAETWLQRQREAAIRRQARRDSLEPNIEIDEPTRLAITWMGCPILPGSGRQQVGGYGRWSGDLMTIYPATEE